MKRDRTGPMGPLALIEEAVFVMRTAPLRVLAPYYVGTLPFVLAILFFWTDMSHGAFAESRLVTGSLGLALLFVWMKAWQAVYARALLDFVTGSPPPAGLARRLVRLAAVQGWHHAIGLVALPIAFLVALPFPWVFAYFQNITVLGDVDGVEPGELSTEARRQATAWPLQNTVVIWLLSPFLMIAGLVLFAALIPIVESSAPQWAAGLTYIYAGLFLLAVIPLSPLGAVIAVNLNIAVSMVPALANMWLGIETPFTQVMGNNTTTWAVVCGLAYLIMDPTLKAAYTLRCFHSRARATGFDLVVGLRQAAERSAKIVLLVIAASFFFVSGPAFAQDATPAGVDVGALDEAITTTLQQREYAWRLPREFQMDERATGFINDVFGAIYEFVLDILRAIGEWVEPIWEWIRGLFDRDRSGRRMSGGVSGETLQMGALAGGALLVLGLAAYLLRRWYLGRTLDADVEAETVAPAPDVEDENVTADALPEDQWTALAVDLLAKGERRLAIRALFLAALARLGEAGFIRLAKFKSNRDYLRELDRRAHAIPEEAARFNSMVGSFERVWYGEHPVPDELIETFRKPIDTVSTHG
jgi:hypothetical protein